MIVGVDAHIDPQSRIRSEQKIEKLFTLIANTVGADDPVRPKTNKIIDN